MRLARDAIEIFFFHTHTHEEEKRMTKDFGFEYIASTHESIFFFSRGRERCIQVDDDDDFVAYNRHARRGKQ